MGLAVTINVHQVSHIAVTRTAAGTSKWLTLAFFGGTEEQLGEISVFAPGHYNTGTPGWPTVELAYADEPAAVVDAQQDVDNPPF